MDNQKSAGRVPPFGLVACIVLAACTASSSGGNGTGGAGGGSDPGTGGADDSGSGGNGDGGSGGNGGSTTGGSGGTNRTGGAPGGSGGGTGTATGGAIGLGGIIGTGGASGGTVGAGGAQPIQKLPCGNTPKWTDISTAQITALGGKAKQSYPGGVSGVFVNRLNGDVTINIVGFGLWRSSNQGASWARIDGNIIDTQGGRSETGWSLQIDADNPTRIASFTLDGIAGYTNDGTLWKGWADSGWGRNWDFGAVDWAGPAQTIFGVLHETSPRNQYLISTNGGASWTTRDSGKVASMVGIIDANTLIATRSTGIERSTNLGASWTSVSNLTPRSHVAVRFQNKFYLIGPDGLLVSADQGASWQKQGVAIANTLMFQGPHFGADANTMVVGVQAQDNPFGGGSAIYKTTNGGTSWTKIANVPAVNNGFPISFSWYGSFAWDPVSDTYYASSMSNPAMRLDCIP